MLAFLHWEYSQLIQLSNLFCIKLNMFTNFLRMGLYQLCYYFCYLLFCFSDHEEK